MMITETQLNDDGNLHELARPLTDLTIQ